MILYFKSGHLKIAAKNFIILWEINVLAQLQDFICLCSGQLKTYITMYMQKTVFKLLQTKNNKQKDLNRTRKSTFFVSCNLERLFSIIVNLNETLFFHFLYDIIHTMSFLPNHPHSLPTEFKDCSKVSLFAVLHVAGYITISHICAASAYFTCRLQFIRLLERTNVLFNG